MPSPDAAARPRTPRSADAGAADQNEVEVEAPRPIGVAALIAALWAVVIGLVVVVVPVLIGWAVAPGPASNPDEALRTSVHLWTAAHQVPVEIGPVTISLLPLGLLLLPATLLFVVGSWAARVTAPRTLGDAFLLSSATALAYAFMASLVNVWASTDAVRSQPGRTFLGTGLVAFVFVTLSVLRTCGFLGVLTASIPQRWRAVLAGSFAGLAVVFAGSALLAGIVLARQLDEAAGAYTAVKAGVVGTVLLTIVALAYVPNVVIWTAGFAVGPGFAVGTGTQVTAAASDTGALPVFPLVAALPSDGAPPVAAAVVMLLPLLAGVLVGLVVARRMRDTDPEHVAGWSAASGALGGVILGVLAHLSGGSVGDGRLSDVGPSGWRVGLLAAVSLAVVAAATGWFAARRRTGRVIALPTDRTIVLPDEPLADPAPQPTEPTLEPPAEASNAIEVDPVEVQVPIHEPTEVEPTKEVPVDLTLTAPITIDEGDTR